MILPKPWLGSVKTKKQTERSRKFPKQKTPTHVDVFYGREGGI
jgi:hypothetical protein